MVSALQKLRQENCWEFAASLGYKREPTQPLSLSAGPRRDAEAAKSFILDMYARVYASCAEPQDGGRKGSRARRFFAHFTCATDTQSVRSVFKDVRDSVLARYLDEINLL